MSIPLSDDPQPPGPDGSDSAGDSDDGDNEWVAILREITTSVIVVLLIAGLFFSISGVWPPLVAVESDSMEDQIMTGDLVFIVDTDRFADEHAIADTGIVPADHGNTVGHESFDRPGDVIIFAPDGNTGDTPIIHRAHYWVEEGENWFDRANPRLIGSADNCEQLANCPAPHAGFITHGDNNGYYDQAQASHSPVKPEWVDARASLRVPYVGNLRLWLDDYLAFILPGIGLAASHIKA